LKAKEFLETQKTELLQHSLFGDPFVTTISTLNEFALPKAQRFAQLYYPHILRTRLYQANALGICPDEQLQGVLSNILHDEYGLGDLSQSHMQQYRKFMQALGVTPAPAEQLEIIPELQMYISTMMRLTQSENWMSAVAAVGVASEYAIPKYYGLLLQGLRKIKGITDDDLTLFVGHITLDLDHAQQIEDAILPYLDDKDNQNKFVQGIQLNMNARKVFHVGLFREIFETSGASS
jgi:pyrroloquinoline-quinone synthase